jgi:hypothetical protein
MVEQNKLVARLRLRAERFASSLTSEQLSHMSSESAAAAVGFAPRSG